MSHTPDRTPRDDLLDALTAERYNGGGWATPSRANVPAHLALHEATTRDDELTTARRRRALVQAHSQITDDVRERPGRTT